MKRKEQHEILDNLIRKTIANDSYLSIKSGESSVQWIHWLDAIDQQNANKGLKNSKFEGASNAKETKVDEAPVSEFMTGEVPGTKDSIHSTMKSSSVFGRGLSTSGDRLHALKLPEAMVAIAQVAAKATDMPGWPLMSNKMQMQKCEKCSQEFCSPLNHRRHMRTVHRRPLNGDKEDLKRKKEQLAAYWDKLTPEEASEIVSSKNISLEDLSGASIVRSLSSHLQPPGLLSLPQAYMKSATALLDIVQSKPSRFPLHAKELFSILEDASEKNLLGGVASTSAQRSFFDSEPGKIGLETKNLVAALGFLVELRLVKAWMDDKDVEALRCQKALVEEEEAAQKKRAKLQERKRQKKMRQKESREKERKGTESLCSLQRLKFDPFSEAGHGEGEDSSTVTQSSPSSSGCSGQDPCHLDASPMDGNEFEGFNDTSERQNNQLADGQEGMHNNIYDVKNERWWGSDMPLISQPPIFDGADSLQASVTYVEASPQLSDQSSSQDGELQSGFTDQRGETGHMFIPFRMPNGKFIPERKVGGQSWRERRQNEGNDYSSYQKHPYSCDRRYYDYSYGSQRVLRKPQNASGNSAPDWLGLFTGPKWNASPRYGQYRDKYSGIRRPALTAGSGHAVWTRKIPQNSAVESDQRDESLEQIGMGLVNDSLAPAKDMHMDHFQPQYACVDASSLEVSRSSGTNCTTDTCPAPEMSVEGLSRNSSISCDSVISHSSISVSARVGAEEQASSPEALSECIQGMDGKEAGEDLNVASGAVVIGSLKISLGDAWANVNENQSCDAKSSEKLGHASQVLKKWGKSPKQEVQEVISRPLQAIETSSPDVLKGTSHVKDTPLCQIVPGEENVPQANFYTDKLVTQGQGSVSLNKVGTMKVWRPVSIGEQSEPRIAGSPSETAIVAERDPAATIRNATFCRNTDDMGVSNSTGDHFCQMHDLTECSDEHCSCSFCIGKTQVSGYPVLDSSCSEGYELSSGNSDALEGHMLHSESSSHQCRPKDGTELSSGLNLKAIPFFADIADFLSRRWEDAIASSDSINLGMHVREAEDNLAVSISNSLPTTLSVDDQSSQCLQDEDNHLHGVGHCPGCIAGDV